VTKAWIASRREGLDRRAVWIAGIGRVTPNPELGGKPALTCWSFRTIRVSCSSGLTTVSSLQAGAPPRGGPPPGFFFFFFFFFPPLAQSVQKARAVEDLPGASGHVEMTCLGPDGKKDHTVSQFHLGADVPENPGSTWLNSGRRTRWRWSGHGSWCS